MVGFFSYGKGIDAVQAGRAAHLFSPSISSISLAVITQNNNVIEKDVTAIFAQIDIPLIADKLTLTAKGRYACEGKTGTDLTGELVYDNSYFAPGVPLDCNALGNNTLYSSGAKRFKSDGVNARLFVPSYFLVPLMQRQIKIVSLMMKASFMELDRKTTLWMAACSQMQQPMSMFSMPAMALQGALIYLEVSILTRISGCRMMVRLAK